MAVTTVHQYIQESIESGRDFCDLEHNEIKEILNNCDAARAVLEDQISVEEKVGKLTGIFYKYLKKNLSATKPETPT